MVLFIAMYTRSGGYDISVLIAVRPYLVESQIMEARLSKPTQSNGQRHNFLEFNCKQEVKKWRILQKAAVVAISFLAASAAHRSPGTA